MAPVHSLQRNRRETLPAWQGLRGSPASDLHPCPQHPSSDSQGRQSEKGVGQFPKGKFWRATGGLALFPLSLSFPTCRRREFFSKGRPGSHVSPRNPKTTGQTRPLVYHRDQPVRV